jgi:group I intron endonuclease
MSYGLIYLATNQDNGLKYIGQTVATLITRRQKHIDSVNAGSTTYFHNAMRSHGINAFAFTVIDTADSQDELDRKERYWIQYYETRERTKGYNTKDGGKLGAVLNEDIIRKISQANTGKKRSPEARAKMSARKKGIPNPAHSERMKRLFQERPSWWIGKTHTEDTKRLLADKHRGKHHSPHTQYPSVTIQCVETGVIFPSISAAARHVGVNPSGFDRLKKHPNQRVKGFHWVRLTA